jgi:intergrase/recombinase
MRLQRRKIPLKFSDIREYWASKMTKHLSQPEIDFIQSRISTNVFMRNYFNPNLISDLKERTLKGYKKMIKI